MCSDLDGTENGSEKESDRRPKCKQRAGSTSEKQFPSHVTFRPDGSESIFVFH